MEVHIYDRDMNLLGVVDEIASLIWTRRYWACGDVKMLLPVSGIAVELLEAGNLMIPAGKREAAEIQYIHINRDGGGMEQIEVQGKFLPSWIGKRVIDRQIVATDNTQAIINRIVRENVTAPADARRKIGGLLIDEQPDLGSGVIEYESVPYDNCLTAISDAAAAAKLGFRVLTDVRQKVHRFGVFKGRDLTAGNPDNPPCIFAVEYDNVLDQDFTRSVENRRNAAYVGGEKKEGEAQVIVKVEPPDVGLDREEVYVDASDIQQTYTDDSGEEVTMPLSRYQAMLAQRGATELEQYTEALTFSGRINQRGGLAYGVDYDLGDRVTCINRRWGVKIDVRITEVTETWQTGGMDLEIVFGESMPTLFQKIRQAARR